MYKILDIEILKNGKSTGRVAEKRPLRQLPSGHHGIVYKKRVFQLYDGNKIDIAKSYFNKNDCPLVITSAKQILHPTDWYIENGFYSYLLLNGGEHICNDVLKLLEENNISWLRSSKSIKKASNGLQYDWFIRLDDDVDTLALKSFLDNALKIEIKKNLAGKSSEEVNEEKIRKLLDKNKILEQDLLKKEEDEKFIDNVIDENYGQREKIELLEERIFELEEQLSEQKDFDSYSLKNVLGKKKDMINKIVNILDVSFPNIEFHDRTYKYLLQVENILPIMRKIYGININSSIKKLIKDFKLKKIKGSDNCWEISKLSDGGKGAQGRLYLLPSINGNRKTTVLLGAKKNQERDIASITKLEKMRS